MRHKFLCLFLILPLIIPIGMIIYHASHQGSEWRVKIQGYDPRDVLRGRYIEFQYDFDNINQPTNICLYGDYKNPNITILEDENCVFEVQLDFKNLSESQRFYIPEYLADDVDKLVRENTDDIRAGIVIRNKRAILKNLYYKDDNILDYLRARNE